MATEYARDYPVARGYPADRGMNLVRWGPVFAGAIIGLAIMLLLGALWSAWAQETTGVADNLEWFFFGSAIFSLLVAGFLAGFLAGTRGWGPGLLHGLTVWGLILVGLIAAGVPSAQAIFDAAATPIDDIGGTALWATFLGMAVGLVLAAIGGVLGGSLRRPPAMYGTMGDDDRYERDRDDDRERELDRDRVRPTDTRPPVTEPRTPSSTAADTRTTGPETRGGTTRRY
jgi:hypothetical protein